MNYKNFGRAQKQVELMFYLFCYQKIIGVDRDTKKLQLANDCHAPKSVS